MIKLKNINFKNISVVLLFFIAINYIFFTYRFFQRENGYILGDWLINYEGGFVRRGFFGETIVNIASILNLNLINLTFFITITIYLIFIFLLFKLIFSKKITFIIALIIFSPATLLFNFYDPLAIGRKEVLFFLFFIFYLFFSKKNFFIFCAPLLSMGITLTHELFTFLLPFFFVNRYLECDSFNLKKYKTEIIIALFSFITFLFIIIFSDPNVEITCNYIKNFGLSNDVCWSINDTARTPLSIAGYLNDKYYFNYYLLFLSLILIPIFICLKKNFNYDLFLIILLVLITIAPIIILFLIVNDWGRYLNVFATIWMLTLISNNKKSEDVSINVSKILILFIFAVSWYMPHCCPERHFSNIKFKPGIFYIYERINYRLNN